MQRAFSRRGAAADRCSGVVGRAKRPGSRRKADGVRQIGAGNARGAAFFRHWNAEAPAAAAGVSKWRGLGRLVLDHGKKLTAGDQHLDQHLARAAIQVPPNFL